MNHDGIAINAAFPFGNDSSTDVNTSTFSLPPDALNLAVALLRVLAAMESEVAP